MNVDAAYFEDGSGAATAILRNSKGEAVAGHSWILKNLLNSTTSEAVALQRGLSMVQDLGCTDVIMESDSLELIQSCNGIIEVWTPYTAILADCFQMASSIGAVSFTHCPRDANRAAHNLARRTYDLNVEVDWDGDPPNFILPDILFDVTVI